MGSRPVNISGTFSKTERPSNGLEELADDLYANQFDTHYVVGVVQYSGVTGNGPGEPLIPRVKFLGIEPLSGDAAEQAKQILDQARKGRGLGRMEESIPARDEALFDFDEDGHPTVPAETRLGPDGPHEVPAPSAEELEAERAERREIEAKLNQDVITELATGEATARSEWGEREEAKAAGVPVPEFSGGPE